MRKIPTIALAIALLSMAGSASAQGYGAPFGSKGTMTFAAERLFGFHWNKNVIDDGDDNNDNDPDFTGTTVGIGWAFAQHLQFNQARLGFDYFLIENLSLGGNLGFFAGSSDGGGVDYDGFIINPRIGYNIPITQAISFWPRGGLQYVSVDSAHAFGLSLEGNFVFLPRPQWGFLLTPSIDLAPFGGIERAGRNLDYSAYSFGVSMGILGIL